MHAELIRERSAALAGLAPTPNVLNLFLSQNDLGVLPAARRAAVVDHVGAVLGTRAPGEVGRPIITRISVQMSGFLARRTKTMIRLTHKSMSPDSFLAQFDRMIFSVRPRCREKLENVSSFVDV